MRTIATMTGMPELRVFEVASFYTMIRMRPVGTYLLQLCGTTPCMLRGAQELMGLLQETLGIQSGETTPDGLFTLMEVECFGGLRPMRPCSRSMTILRGFGPRNNTRFAGGAPKGRSGQTRPSDGASFFGPGGSPGASCPIGRLSRRSLVTTKRQERPRPMLAASDRIFTNLHGREAWDLAASRQRGDWTKPQISWQRAPSPLSKKSRQPAAGPRRGRVLDGPQMGFHAQRTQGAALSGRERR